MTWIKCLCGGNNLGEKSRRMKNFLLKHPVCCFCGGSQQATTQDHLPPRSVFDNKKWPEGYVFPACYDCNSGSSKYDSIFALVSRIHPSSEESDYVKNETEKLILAYVEQYPQEAASLKLSANEKKRWAKNSNFKLAKGQSYGELSIIKMPNFWNRSVEIVSTKLIKALHYKHTGKIVPKDSGIRIKWWTNAQYIAGQFPKELTELVGERAFVKREKLNLSNQFSYSYQTSENGQLAIYGAYFRFSFYVVGLVSFDASLLKVDANFD